VQRLKELVEFEVKLLEARRHDPVGMFDHFCTHAQHSYVLESSHPYSNEEIDQCLEIDIEGATDGVCIAFDPRSDTRAGDGHISFLLEGATREDWHIQGISGVSQLYRGRGLELNLRASAERQERQETPPEGEWADENYNLPGVNGCPPLYLPSGRFVIRWET
jgi:hypothetical protein